MATWRFETEQKDFSFTIEAEGLDEAFREAYEYYGPQVNDMFAKIIN